MLVRENVGERGLKEAVDTFAKHLKKGGIGLFFFAGHGIQVKDQNFLMPIDVGFESEADIAYKGVSAEYVLSALAALTLRRWISRLRRYSSKAKSPLSAAIRSVA